MNLEVGLVSSCSINTLTCLTQRPGSYLDGIIYLEAKACSGAYPWLACPDSLSQAG